jgi:hypothetical protein
MGKSKKKRDATPGDGALEKRVSPRLEKKSKRQQPLDEDDDIPFDVLRSKQRAKSTTSLGLDAKFALDQPSLYIRDRQNSIYCNQPTSKKFYFESVAAVEVPGAGAEKAKSMMSHMLNIVCDVLPYELVKCTTKDKGTNEYKQKLKAAQHTWEKAAITINERLLVHVITRRRDTCPQWCGSIPLTSNGRVLRQKVEVLMDELQRHDNDAALCIAKDTTDSDVDDALRLLIEQRNRSVKYAQSTAATLAKLDEERKKRDAQISAAFEGNSKLRGDAASEMVSKPQSNSEDSNSDDDTLSDDGVGSGDDTAPKEKKKKKKGIDQLIRDRIEMKSKRQIEKKANRDARRVKKEAREDARAKRGYDPSNH